MSKVTSKGGLFVETNEPELFKKKIFADPEVQTALKEMPMLAIPNYDIQKDGITIFLHNIQSLNKHCQDLKKDPRCWNADIICLTETWIKPGQNISTFEIEGFSFHQTARGDVYNDSNAQVLKLQSSKGGGVAVYINQTGQDKIVHSLPEKNFEGICVKCLSEDMVVLTVYRPQSLNVTQFLLQLEKLIEYYKLRSKMFVCLGDFNEDARSAGPIQTFMTHKGFKQIVNFPTTEGATTLDHVYLSSSINANVENIPTYYSYHDALMLKINTNT